MIHQLYGLGPRSLSLNSILPPGLDSHHDVESLTCVTAVYQLQSVTMETQFNYLFQV
ncbi:UNVERIFIED_CONTAM: hypothetical protein FKN15_055221 [Acipenser sinensis]